jgi:hypothetical protein
MERFALLQTPQQPWQLHLEIANGIVVLSFELSLSSLPGEEIWEANICYQGLYVEEAIEYWLS